MLLKSKRHSSCTYVGLYGSAYFLVFTCIIVCLAMVDYKAITGVLFYCFNCIEVARSRCILIFDFKIMKD